MLKFMFQSSYFEENFVAKIKDFYLMWCVNKMLPHKRFTVL